MSTTNSRVQIHHIFYDEETRRTTPKSFIPLDNMIGPRDWFEFYAIWKFLRDSELEDEVFYGFFSPKFQTKFGLTGCETIHAVQSNASYDVILFSYGWDQLCFFLNPWEQGEHWHPGISSATQKFLDWAEIPVDIMKLLTTRRTAVFSNFIVAKPVFWRKWLSLADKFLEFTKLAQSGFSTLTTRHRSDTVPMKVFIQERFPAILLSEGTIRTIPIHPPNLPIRFPLLKDIEEVREILLRCDELKELMLSHGRKPDLLQEFLLTRGQAMTR
jgi:hypothetical protein